MDKPVTWNELRALLNMQLKETDIIDWINLGHPGIADPVVVRYNGNHIKIYDRKVPDIMGGGTIVTTKKTKKKRKPITSLIPATRKKKTKKKKR